MRTIISALAITLVVGTSVAKEVLPFVKDDYSAAMARARTKNVPVFVEAWAPW